VDLWKQKFGAGLEPLLIDILEALLIFHRAWVTHQIFHPNNLMRRSNIMGSPAAADDRQSEQPQQKVTKPY
jgi:hypothetical protein